MNNGEHTAFWISFAVGLVVASTTGMLLYANEVSHSVSDQVPPKKESA